MKFTSLKEALDISPEESSRLGGFNDKIKDVAEYLSDAAEAFEDSSLVEAFKKAAPWAAEITDSAGDAIPVVKFATSLLSKLLREKDSEVLGRLACTLAYQSAVEQSAKKVGEPLRKPLQLKKNLKDFIPSPVVDFKTLSISNALSHSFTKEADRALLYFSERAGYSKDQRTQLQTATHRFFIEGLRLILTSRETAEKFEPFRRLMSMGVSEQSPYDGLDNHAEYQRRLFEEAKVFNTEPFALKHVYVDTDCSHLTWGEINSKEEKRKDPFAPGLPRKPVLETVMQLIGDSKLDDAIVIQGVAGSGKSSFTLRLCKELLEKGFRPIRIRLRDISLDMDIRDALPRAVLLHDEFQPLAERGYASHDDLFMGGNLFRERIFFNGFHICPNVLILDGWDEISLSAPEGFREQVTRMLRELRDEYLKNREPKVRVIITGRPSIDVAESHFLLQNTPVLTLRALRPEQLEMLVENLVNAIETAPLGTSGTTFANKADLPKILAQYRAGFKSNDTKEKTPTERISGSMEIFSLPLLAHLAMRLVAVMPGQVDQILESPTNLYRNLVDLTVWRRGRFGEGSDSIVESTPPDTDLRTKLQQTAVAITVLGKESISSRELAVRLGFKPKQLETWAKDSTENHFLTELLINFFFKGGNEKLGCEFLHKSFREYLFAEYVVEVLKNFGRKQTKPWPERSASEYWKDFPENSDLWRLSRGLAECLGAHWIKREIANHIDALITWEIGRAGRHQSEEEAQGSTAPLTVKEWEYVRDGLADLWDWWAEGVHLRPQVIEDRRQLPEFRPAYVEQLIEISAPREIEAQSPQMLTVRTTTVDAHLGDAVFQLNVVVHYGVALRHGWLNRPAQWGPGELANEIWKGVSEPGTGPRRYQTTIRQGAREWTLFAPAGPRPDYFEFYTARINAAGWRGQPFPAGTTLSGTDLRETSLALNHGAVSFHFTNLSEATLTLETVFSHSSLANSSRLFGIGFASFNDCDLTGGEFRIVKPLGIGLTIFSTCNLERAKFDLADLSDAHFRKSPTKDATFNNALLEGAKFDEVSRPTSLAAQSATSTSS